MQTAGRVTGLLLGLAMLTGCGAGAGASARLPAAQATPSAPAGHTPGRRQAHGRSGTPTADLPYVYGLQMATPTTGWIEAGALFRTTNGAASWHQVFQRPGAVLAWAAPTAQRAWVVMQTGAASHLQVWATADAGTEWHAQSLAAPWPVTSVHLQVTAGGMGSLIALGPLGNGMQSGGERLWQIIGGALVTSPAYTTRSGHLLDASWVSSADGWATAASAAGNDTASVLRQTTDGGRQWTPVALPLPAGIPSPPAGSSHFLPSLALGPAPVFVEPQDGYLAAALSTAAPPATYPVLYHTTSGAGWTVQWLGPIHHTFTQLRWVTPQVVWAVLAPGFGPSATQIGVSASGGRSWTLESAPVPSARVYDLVPVSSSEAVLFALLPSQQLAVYATANGGRTWQARG